MDQQSYQYNITRQEFDDLKNDVKDLHKVFDKISDIAISTERLANWLSYHLTEIYYLLATPYKIDLGPVDMPLSYNEITNIFTDSDLMPNINAKYYRNFITTIQNLQVNEKALKQELIDINNRLTALETAKDNVVESEEEANDIQVQ